MKLIESQSSVGDYFHELLRKALHSHKVEIATSSRVYLVHLFDEFLRAERFHEVGPNDDPGPPTLAWLYERACHGATSSRFEAWRHLGDVSLMVSSVFGAYVERRQGLVGMDYYVQMGTGAYETAAGYAQTTGMVPVLRELSRKFRILVDVLTQIGEAANLPVAKSIERLYERWLSANCPPDVHNRLTQLGASPLLVGAAKA